MKIGLQLYNFREALGQDFKGAMKEIAKIGFEGVEFACNYGGIPADELKAFMAELKLETAGAMFGPDELLDVNNGAWAYSKALNPPTVTVGYYTDYTKEWKEVMAMLAKIGDNAAANGTVFSYHNHWWEFVDIDGEWAMERILAGTDATKIFMEPDVCWLTRSGVAPAEFINKYAKRICQVHIKDTTKPEEPECITELGKGVVDITGSVAAAKAIGAKWAIYEQDFSKDPFQSAADSLAVMKKLV